MTAARDPRHVPPTTNPRRDTLVTRWSRQADAVFGPNWPGGALWGFVIGLFSGIPIGMGWWVLTGLVGLPTPSDERGLSLGGLVFLVLGVIAVVGVAVAVLVVWLVRRGSPWTVALFAFVGATVPSWLYWVTGSSIRVLFG